ncbi:hypothetical protein [Pararhizobium haloflavum]|uniref:hypothetical protein n=1 Tax=Pararhizobium haloflavum TaxID=2037914 RepID=UPI000C1926E8|nr:hypothetical protein [Pararhizobium haloflavum]
MRLIPKEVESLWTLFTAPTIWAVHFLVCYVGAAVFCAKRNALGLDFITVRSGIGIVTVIALLAILGSGWLAWRQWGFGTHEPPHDEPSHHDRNRFQGFATLLLCALSFVAVIFTAMPAAIITECNP